MNNIWVSVIVPVYNAEKTVEKCIQSVLNQKEILLELILVNDGSSDRSRVVCEKYVALDSRVKLINNTNHGVSYSRNCGIDNAKGKYIFFLDADDWIEKDVFSKLKSIVDTGNPDVVFSGFYKEYKTSSLYITTCEEDISIYEKGQKEFNPYHTRMLGTVWGKLYKREYIGDSRFNGELKLCEDAEFNYRILPKAELLMYVNIASYHYSYLLTSTLRKYDPQQIEEYYKSIEVIEEEVRNLDKDVIESSLAFTCNVLNVIIMNNIFSLYNKVSVKEKIRHLKELTLKKSFTNAIYNVGLSDLSMIQKIVILLLRRKKYRIVWILSMLNRLRSSILYK